MMRRKYIGKFKIVLSALLVLAILLPWTASVSSAADTNDDYLRASGNALYDISGNPVRLTGIAWFGFETQNQVYHGLWSVKMEDVLDTVADRGFNVLRVPLCVQLVDQWRNGDGGQPGSVNYSANPALEGLSSLQILDASIAYCKQIGLKVMLDMHRVVNTQMLNAWYTDGYPPGDFEACWQWLARHYANDDTVLAMDLFNEPHGTPGDPNMVKWDDSTDPNNWKYEAEKVAKLVLDENPGLLVVVEGIEATPKDGYTYEETNSANYDFNWWGGNLRRVKDYPIDVGGRQSQVVYSPHDYGPGVYAQPWFYPGFIQATLTADCWEPNWLYIIHQGLAPVLVGEWGGRMDGGDNEKWMGYLANTIAQFDLNHTFWCVNPNSGDTGGILLDDWQTVDAAKYELIEPTLWQDNNGKYIGLDHRVNLGANGTHVGDDSIPTENNSFISPTTATFDKNPSAQADIAVTLTLNGNTLEAIRNGSGALIAGTDYAVADTLVTISKNYLADQAESTVNLTFDFSAGLDPVLTVNLIDSGTDNDSPASCSPAVSSTLPLVIDGAGEYCRVTSGDISHINSWNMELVEINGQDFTNIWSNQMPARIDGNYYIHYVGNYAWSHLEVAGSGGSQTANYTLYIEANGNGTTDPPIGAYTYTPGTPVSVSAIPSSGATFTGWSGAATGTSNPITVTMEADKTLTANFSGGDDGLPDECTGPCSAATPVYPTILGDGGLGNVTMYTTEASDGGACNYGTTDVMSFAAMSVDVLPGDAQAQWQGGRICGQCAEVTALTSQGPKSVVVRIMDKCPDEFCGIDLGGSAPGQIMLDGFGRYTGKWRFISCQGHPEVSDGPPTLDVLPGSNPWWSRVHVRNGAMATATIEWEDTVAATNGEFPFATNPENAFEVPVYEVLQSGSPSFLITVHYVDGSTASVTLSPDQLAAGSASYPLD